jgi:hypothetical protein
VLFLVFFIKEGENIRTGKMLYDVTLKNEYARENMEFVKLLGVYRIVSHLNIPPLNCCMPAKCSVYVTVPEEEEDLV